MTDTTELFLISGATGKTGAPTVGLLRERGFRVRALVHTLDDRATRLQKQGAEVIQGDLLDFDAVSSALVGVSAAYFCYPIDPPRLLEATAIFARAATEAGVRAVVSMSQSPARRDARYYGPREHWIAERLLDRTHLMTTHLRPTLFADWLSWQWARHDGQGLLRLPFGNARHAPIASADQARVIAAILANPAPHDRQIYPLYGPEELDHHAIAQKMAQVLGISVRYEPVDIESFAAAMRAQGASPFLAQYLSNVARDYQNSAVFAGTNNLVEAIGGTPPMTVEQYTAATRASFESDGQYAAWESVTDELGDARSLATS
jgi:NAD(P)H dehydrogenase (quinone)